MPSIGVHNFVTLNGKPTSFQTRLERLERVGADGLLIRDLGKKSQPFTLTSEADFATAGAAEIAFDAYEGDVGEVVHIVDDQSVFHSNYVILSVERVSQRKAAMVVGGFGTGAGRVVMTCRWTLQAAGVPS